MTLFDELFDALADLGFRKRAGKVFTTDLSPGWIGWLGLNTASRFGQAGDRLLHPIVGVRSQALEAHLSDFRGVKRHQYVPPTVKTPLQYLAPINRRREWIYLSAVESEWSATSSDLVSGLIHHGLPYIRESANLDAVLETVTKRAPHDEDAAMRWPVALWMSGDADGAVAASATLNGWLSDRSDPAAMDTRAFLQRLENAIVEDLSLR